MIQCMSFGRSDYLCDVFCVFALFGFAPDDAQAGSSQTRGKPNQFTPFKTESVYLKTESIYLKTESGYLKTESSYLKTESDYLLKPNLFIFFL